MSAMKLEGVVAGYGQGDILRGVNLEVRSGSVMCVIGPNGAGKSTILRSVSGLLRPRAGTIVVDGESIASLKPRAPIDIRRLDPHLREHDASCTSQNVFFHDLGHTCNISANGAGRAGHAFQQRLSQQLRNLGRLTVCGLTASGRWHAR